MSDNRRRQDQIADALERRAEERAERTGEDLVIAYAKVCETDNAKLLLEVDRNLALAPSAPRVVTKDAEPEPVRKVVGTKEGIWRQIEAGAKALQTPSMTHADAIAAFLDTAEGRKLHARYDEA